jgi:hypothetical protein
MAILETSQKWTFTGSTGSGKAINVKGYAQALTFGIETSAGCSGTVEILHRIGSSAGPYSIMHSTAPSSNVFATAQLLGPLEWVKPRLATLTSGSTNIVTVYLLGN